MGRDGGDDLMTWDLLYNSDGTRRGYRGDEEIRAREISDVEDMIGELESKIDEMKDEVKRLRVKLGMGQESVIEKLLMKLDGLENDVFEIGDDLKEEIEESFD
jgi:predicted  nucleic acid-binding Zn-ribbon protein